jgi:hypothetical protein
MPRDDRRRGGWGVFSRRKHDPHTPEFGAGSLVRGESHKNIFKFPKITLEMSTGVHIGSSKSNVNDGSNDGNFLIRLPLWTVGEPGICPEYFRQKLPLTVQSTLDIFNPHVLSRVKRRN